MRIHGMSVLLGAKLFGDVQWRRGGLAVSANATSIRDQSFDGHDHGDGLHLGGHAVAGPFGFHVGNIPETGEDLVATCVEPAEVLRVLLYELLLNGGTVLKHPVADSRLGFGVGGSIGVEAGGFR